MFVYTFEYHLAADRHIYKDVVVRADDLNEAWELASKVGVSDYRCPKCGDRNWYVKSVVDFRDTWGE